jgi:myo-inositol-1(or 4)-monophosphatase
VVGDKDDFDLLKDAALQAGELALSFFRRNPNTWAKAGGSPVTEADMAVDAFLKGRLLSERPAYGWLSEETADDLIRRERDTVFVVDPIDGTRGFIAGDDRWCVSLGLVRSGRPVAAVLYAPARGEFYRAAAGEGAWIGERRLAVSSRRDLRGARLAGPRGWLKSEALRNSGADVQLHVPSLAYRFAMVAAGKSDAAFSSPRSHDWDLAACDLLVHEAGGLLTSLDGAAPSYNREMPHHGVLAAANADLQPLLVATLEQAAAERALGGLPV